jgi:hypothetical protein
MNIECINDVENSMLNKKHKNEFNTSVNIIKVKSVVEFFVSRIALSVRVINNIFLL